MTITLDEVLAVVRQIEPDAARAGKLGPEALTHLRVLVRSDDLSLARRAASVTTKIDDPRARDVVGIAAKSPHPEIRLAAASELWRLAKHDVTRLAVRLLADPDQVVRRRTLRSLAVVVADTQPKPSLRRQIAAMAARDPSPANRALAEVVAHRGSKEAIPLENLHAALSSGIAPRDLAPALDRKDDFPSVEQLAASRDTDVAASAVLLATMLAARTARPVVERAALDRRVKVREAAASTAARVPGGSELLRALLLDKHPGVREAAFVSAARSRLPGFRKIATRLSTSDPDERIRALAAEFLRAPPQTFR